MTDVDTVRLLTADLATVEADRMFTDDQYQEFLDLEGGVKLAAAQALDVMATSEVMVAKVIRTQDLATDGAKVAAELRARAQSLRDQANSGEGDADDAFAVVPYGPGCGVELAEHPWRWPWGWL